MHNQIWYPTFLADVNNQKYIHWKNQGVESIQKASNHNPTYLWKRASKLLHIQTNSKTPFLKTAAKLWTKEIRSATLHVDTTPG